MDSQWTTLPGPSTDSGSKRFLVSIGPGSGFSYESFFSVYASDFSDLGDGKDIRRNSHTSRNITNLPRHKISPPLHELLKIKGALQSVCPI